MGGGGQTSSTKTTIPAEYKPLARTTAANVQGLQRAAPLQPFLQPYQPQMTLPSGTTFSSPGTTTPAPTAADTPFGLPTGKEAKAEKKELRLEERLNRLYGKQAKKATKGKSSAGLDRRIGKVEGKLGALSPASMAGPTPDVLQSATPFDATSLLEEPVSLRDIFTPQGERVTSGEFREFLPQGAGIEDNPAITAALEAFRKKTAPALIDQAGLAGLGRSTAALDSVADAEAQLMLPLILSELDREERAISGELAREEGGIAKAYNDFLRQQGLAEQALFTPFGGFVPSTFGQRVTTSGGK